MNPNPTSYGGNSGGQGQPPQTYQETLYASNQPGSNPNNSYNPNPYGPNPNPYGAPPPSNPGSAPYDPYAVPPTVAATPPSNPYGAPPTPNQGTPYPYPNTAPPANPYPNQAPPTPNQGTPYPYPNNAPPANPYAYPGSVPPPSYPGTPPAPRSSGNKVLLIVLAIVVVLGGLVTVIGVSAHNSQVATDNAHATATAQANVTATAQVKATATAVASTYPFSANLKLSDPMTDNTKGMGWIEDKGCKFTSDGYHASENLAKTYYTCPAMKANFSNFTYQVSMKIMQGDLAGISFRGNDDQAKYYTFIIKPSTGSYWLLLYTQKGQSAQTLYHNSTSYITNAANQLGVVARGGKIALYINGHELTSTTDSTLSSGQIGTVVYNGVNEGDTVEAVYSDLKVWQL